MAGLFDADRHTRIVLRQGSENELVISELKCACCDKKYIVFVVKGRIQLSLDDARRLAKQIYELALIAANKP